MDARQPGSMPEGIKHDEDKLRVCKNHPQRKVCALGLCKNCYDKHLKTVNPEYKKRQRDNHSKWAKLHPNYKAYCNERRRIRDANKRKIDPIGYYIKMRDKNLRSEYGISYEDYNMILLKQGGGCAICGRKPNPKYRPNYYHSLHVDHDHNTGKVRGILCHQCNWYMGTIDANPRILQNIYEYRNR